jgi:predicted RNase H-like HicB family nuclease
MKYLVELFWSEEDGGYIAVVPDLPGCSAFGGTPEAAVHEIGDASEAWIAACRASGDRVPEPTAKARDAAGTRHAPKSACGATDRASGRAGHARPAHELPRGAPQFSTCCS